MTKDEGWWELWRRGNEEMGIAVNGGWGNWNGKNCGMGMGYGDGGSRGGGGMRYTFN